MEEQEKKRERSFAEELSEKLNTFAESDYGLYLSLALLLIACLSIVIRMLFLQSSILNFLPILLGCFATGMLVVKVQQKEALQIRGKSVAFLAVILLSYSTVFGMIGLPVIPLLSIGIFGNFLLYTMILYILFLFFFMKRDTFYTTLCFRIFLLFAVLDLLVPFVLLFL